MIPLPTGVGMIPVPTGVGMIPVPTGVGMIPVPTGVGMIPLPPGVGMIPLPPGVGILLDPASIVIRPLSRRRRLAVGHLPQETPIVLIGSRIGARGRLRAVAAISGLRIEREYVVLPSWRSPSFVVEDDVNTLRWFWSTFATVPPGMSSGGRAADLALRLGRRGALLALLGRLAPGRVVIARRR